jgi:hypothetical protein
VQGYFLAPNKTSCQKILWSDLSQPVKRISKKSALDANSQNFNWSRHPENLCGAEFLDVLRVERDRPP